jgi:hypothetical protein
LRPDAWKLLAIKAEVAVRKEGNSANSANPEGLENKFFTEFWFYSVFFSRQEIMNFFFGQNTVVFYKPCVFYVPGPFILLLANSSHPHK